MNTDSAVFKAMMARYETIPLSEYAFSRPNIEFDPSSHKKWARITGFPSPVRRLSLSDNGSNEFVGFFQIDLFNKLGTGAYSLLNDAGVVCNYFKRGVVFFDANVKVELSSSYTGPIIITDTSVSVPITVNYRVYAKN